ncbi:hypothetical protein [Actinacidiphila acidipaludis]|uniref:Uncharacterized protein n=1 Tax=Actinacidiphila acidipaludis TaxID=2873382 RepID=A0ABS7QH42_9ACTN|nr:hypothetical protein [Streptomyces acidipaludis]MBY8882487.1 hypothetical protein [Streptomyces acidipaludis]
MTTDSSPLPEGEPPVPDDVWDRFLADSERDIRATAPKEPSARARIVARRLREEDEKAAAEAPRGRFGRRGRGPVRAAPHGWRSGTTDEAERRLARRRLVRGAIGVILAVLVVLILLSPGRAWSLVSGGGWGHNGAAVPAPVATLTGSTGSAGQ